MRYRDSIAAVESEVIWTVDHSPYRSFGDREFKRARTQCNKNPDFAICEIASESGPSDPEMIRTVDHSPYRSFGDREFKRARTQCNKNPDFAICEIASESGPLIKK
jgi:hypothetical protein